MRKIKIKSITNNSKNFNIRAMIEYDGVQMVFYEGLRSNRKIMDLILDVVLYRKEPFYNAHIKKSLKQKNDLKIMYFKLEKLLEEYVQENLGGF